jgi:hypothetical protein
MGTGLHVFDLEALYNSPPNFPSFDAEAAEAPFWEDGPIDFDTDK